MPVFKFFSIPCYDSSGRVSTEELVDMFSTLENLKDKNVHYIRSGDAIPEECKNSIIIYLGDDFVLDKDSH